MPTPLLRRSLLLRLLIAGAYCVACSAPAPQAPAPQPISAEHAKRVAVKHFNETFAGRLHLGPASGEYIALPEIKVDDIVSTKLEDDVWVVERNARVGLGFVMRVARDGRWVAVEQVYSSTL